VRRRRIASGALIALVLVPFVVALVVVSTQSWWRPGGDQALIGLRAWDVGRDTPLLGPYSRNGWNHPGPLLFWLLAVPVRLLGSIARGSIVGAIVVNAAAAVAVVVLVARRVGLIAAAGAVGLVAVLTITDPGSIGSDWNPHVTLLPYLAFVVGAWAVADGDLVGWPVAGLAAVLCVQSHVGYAALVIALVAVALALRAVAWWSAGRPVPARRSVVVAGGSVLAAAGLMVPILIDQFTGTGNLGRLVTWFRASGRETIGLRAASGLASRQLLPWGPWAGGSEVVPPLAMTTPPVSARWLALPAVALLVTAVIAVKRRDFTVVRLVALVATSAVVGLVSLSSVDPPAFPYLFVWFRIVAATVWATVALGLGRAVVPLVRAAWCRRHRGDEPVEPVPSTHRSRPMVVASVLVGVLLAVVPVSAAAVSAATSPLPESMTGRATDALLPAARELVAPGETFSITSEDPYAGVVAGLGVALVEEGRNVVVDPDLGIAWGTRRVGDIEGPGVVRLHVVNRHQLVETGTPAGWVEAARWDPLDPAEQLEREQLRSRLTAQAQALGDPFLGYLFDSGPWPLLTAPDTGLDPGDVQRYVELARQGQPVALFEDRG